MFEVKKVQRRIAQAKSMHATEKGEREVAELTFFVPHSLELCSTAAQPASSRALNLEKLQAQLETVKAADLDLLARMALKRCGLSDTAAAAGAPAHPSSLPARSSGQEEVRVVHARRILIDRQGWFFDAIGGTEPSSQSQCCEEGDPPSRVRIQQEIQNRCKVATKRSNGSNSLPHFPCSAQCPCGQGGPQL